MSLFVYPPVSLSISGGATAAKQDAQTALLTAIDADTSNISTKSDAIATSTASIDGKITTCDTGAVVVSTLPNVTLNTLTPVDFLDSGVVNSASTNITAGGLSVVASLAANVKELEIVDDIGDYMTLTNGAGTVLAYLPLGGGRVKVSIASGTALKLASVSGSTISSGKIAINFLG